MAKIKKQKRKTPKKSRAFSWQPKDDENLKKFHEQQAAISTQDSKKGAAGIFSKISKQFQQLDNNHFPDSKQCRERWCNKLKPGLSFIKQIQDQNILDFIFQTYEKRGNQWKEISKDVLEKTNLEFAHNDIKNFCNSKKRERELKNLKETSPCHVENNNITPEISNINTFTSFFHFNDSPRSGEVDDSVMSAALSNFIQETSAPYQEGQVAFKIDEIIPLGSI